MSYDEPEIHRAAPQIADNVYEHADKRIRTRITNSTSERVPVDGSFSPSGLKNSGLHTEVSINDSTWVALPSTALTDRNAIAVQNNTNVVVYINHSNSATIQTGMRIQPGGERTYDIKDTIVIYGMSDSGNQTLDVEELS